jgi:outer membrane protein assembly factor BamB
MTSKTSLSLRAVALAIGCALSGASHAGTTWTMYQADAAHSGYVALSLTPAKFRLKWQKQLSSLPLSPVTVGRGKVFVSSIGYFNAQSLYALAVTTGETSWSHEYTGIFTITPPSYGGGKVYMQTVNHSSDTYLRAFDAVTGTQVFQAAHPAQWERYYAPTVYGTSVYANGGYYGGMLGFSGKTGAPLWSLGLTQYDQWTPAVDAKYVYTYVGNQYSVTAGLSIVDRLSGQLVSKIEDPSFSWSGWSMNQAPALGGRHDAYAINNGRLLKFDTTALQLVWQKAGSYSGQVAVANGVVYAYASGSLQAINQGTGKVLWSWAPPAGTLSSNIVLTDTHAFVGTDTTTYCVDLLQHSSVWNTPVAGWLAADAGSLFISGKDGQLTAIKLDI